MHTHLHLCRTCGDPILPAARAALRPTCLPCGEISAVQARKSWCVAPMHKSNYMLITNRADLLGINNKGGIIK